MVEDLWRMKERSSVRRLFLFLCGLLCLSKGPIAACQFMSQSSGCERSSVDSDLEWDHSQEVPSFVNCSNLTEEELFHSPRGERLDSSTDGRILDGLSVIGAHFPILDTPESPNLSLENISEPNISGLFPPGFLESIDEDEIEVLRDCSGSSEEEEELMPNKNLTVEENHEKFIKKVDKFNEFVAVVEEQGRMDNRMQEILEDFVDDIHELYDNIKGKLNPNLEAPAKVSSRSVLSKLCELRLKKEDQLRNSDAPNPQNENSKYDELDVKFGACLNEVKESSAQMDQILSLCPEGSKSHASEAEDVLKELDTQKTTAYAIHLEMLLEVQKMQEDDLDVKKEEIVKKYNSLKQTVVATLQKEESM